MRCGQHHRTGLRVDDTSFENPIATSLPTDGSGQFSLAVPAHQTVVIVPLYNQEEQTVSHTFNPSSVTLNTTEQRIQNLNFIDNTTQPFTNSLSGGLCNLSIASVLPVVVLPSCASRRWTSLPGFTNGPITYLLPATTFTFLSYSGRSGEPQPSSVAATALSAGELVLLNGFLQVQGQFNLDLSSQPVTSVLLYHGPSHVNLFAPGSLSNLQCASNNTDSHGNRWLYSILRQDAVVTLTFRVWEQYGGTACYSIDPTLTSVWVKDLVSPVPALPCYNPGCAVNVSSTGIAYYTTRLGTPYFLRRNDGPDYTRDLLYGIADTAGREGTRISILITGTYVYEGVESVKLAPSSLVPAYILRRPPGGSSMSDFSGSFTMSTDVSLDISTGLSSSIGYDISVNGAFQTYVLTAPLGLGIEIPGPGFSGEVDSLGFVPVMPKLPSATSIRQRMVVPQLDDNVLASVLASPASGLYDPSDILAPFRPTQDCSVLSVIKGFAQSALANVEFAAEQLVQPLIAGRRRLMAGEFDCESTTDKSLSLGEEQSYSVSIETSDDPAIINGDGDMFLFVVHDVLISTTNVLIASNVPGQSKVNTTEEPYSASLATSLSSSTQCQILTPTQIKTASSSGDSQLLWVSQWSIINQIIPLSQAVSAQLNSSAYARPLDEVTQGFADALSNSTVNWNTILQYNAQLKAAAVPWPDLLQYLTFNTSSSSVTGSGHNNLANPFYLQGDDLVVSFSGDMGSIAFSVDYGLSQDASLGSGLSNSGSSSASLGGKVNVAGFGLSASINWEYSNSEEVDGGSDLSSGNDRSLSFELSDPDRGDSFDVVIRRDPVYNTPVFITRAGKSRCQYEQGTVVRESLAPTWSTNGSLATDVYSAVLQVANTGLATETEAFSYYVNLNTETNVNGWTVTVNGVPVLQNGVRVTIPNVSMQSSTGATTLLVIVSRGSGAYGTANLQFTLTGICYEDIVSPAQYAYSPPILPLSVTLQPPSSITNVTAYDALPVPATPRSTLQPSLPFLGPLDSLRTANMYLAVSLRQLFSGATRALQAQRVSDNATLDIYFLRGGSLDTGSLTAFASGGDVTVATWYDQSGAGNHLTAHTTFSRGPFIVMAGLLVTANRSLTALRFNNIDNQHSHSTLFAPAANNVGYVSAVLQRDGGINNIGFVLGSLSSYYWHSTNNMVFSPQNCNPVVCNGTSTGTDNGGSNVYRPAYNTPMPDGQLNIVSVQTTGNVTGTQWDNIGSDRDTVHNLAGYYFELIVYSLPPSASDQATILSSQISAY